MEERKKTKVSLGTAVSIFIIIILLVIIALLVYKLRNTKILENNTNLAETNNYQGVVENTNSVSNNISSNKQVNSENNTQDTQQKTEKLDVTIDKKEDTILIEGMETKVKTAKYVSSLGYSMRYDYERFTPGKDEGMDIYDGGENSDIYYTVERYSTSYEKAISSLSSYKKININGNEAVYTTKVVAGILETIYYIKADNGVFIITTHYPNSSEYEEGIGSIIAQMIQTFSII